MLCSSRQADTTSGALRVTAKVFGSCGVIPKDLLLNKSIPQDTKLVLAYITTRATETGSYFTITEAAEALGIGEGRVEDAIEVLMDEGYLA